MMLLFAFLSLTLASFTGAEQDCDTPIREICDFSKLAKGLISTKEELKQQCKDGRQVLQCAVYRLSECDLNSNELPKFVGLLSKVDDLCSVDNIIYQAIYENIECLANAYEKSVLQCPSIATVRRNIDKVMEKSGLTAKLKEQYSCETALEGFGCILLGMHLDCGGVPVLAVVETLQTFNLPVQCSADISAELREMFEEIISDGESNE